MKEIKPTIRVVSKILGYRVSGWNDKRKSYNRIKLDKRLSYNEMSVLESELVFRFPQYEFAIGDVRWESYQLGGPRFVTTVSAIKFWKK